MGIGVGILLLVIGLILVLEAIDFPDVDHRRRRRQTIGWICVIVGVLALVLALVMNQQRSKTTHVEERREL